MYVFVLVSSLVKYASHWDKLSFNLRITTYFEEKLCQIPEIFRLLDFQSWKMKLFEVVLLLFVKRGCVTYRNIFAFGWPSRTKLKVKKQRKHKNFRSEDFRKFRFKYEIREKVCFWKSNPMIWRKIWRCEFQNSEVLCSHSKTVVSKPLKMAFNKNPWMVESIESFSFYCCPECVFRSKEETFFQAHALQNHSQSTSLFHNYGGDHVILTGCQMTNLVSNFECLFWFTIMAFPVVEFSRQGYKVRKVFG